MGATSYNEGSSRSHTILRVAVESSAAPGSAAAARGDPRTLSYLNLIDLAGSESARVRPLVVDEAENVVLDPPWAGRATGSLSRKN